MIDSITIRYEDGRTVVIEKHELQQMLPDQSKMYNLVIKAEPMDEEIEFEMEKHSPFKRRTYES